MLNLDIAISTYTPDGILRVEKMLPEAHPHVRYVVSWQQHGNAEIPERLKKRNDVEIHRLDKKGLSNNRNNALDHCHGDIIYIADDDLILKPDLPRIITEAFEQNPGVDLITFQIEHLKKTYPEKSCWLSLPMPKNYYVSSVEIAIRRQRLGNLRFYPELGLGSSKMQCGEEEFFMISALKRGLKAKFISEVVASHPQATTGAGNSPGILRGQGFVMASMYPFSSLLRIPLKSLRNKKEGKSSFFTSLRYLFSGAFLRLKQGKRIPASFRG